MLRTIFAFLLLISTDQAEAVPAQARGQQQQGDAEKQKAVPQAPVPSVQSDVEQSKAGSAGERTDNQTQITIDDTRSNAPAWVSAVLSFFLLVAILFQAWTYSEQLKAMRKSVKISQRQAFTLKRQAVAMRDQLQALRQQVRSADFQTQISRSQLRTTEDQLNVMRESLRKAELAISLNEKAVKAAQQSADAAQQTLIHSQRAYVTIPRGNIQKREDGSQVFQLELANSGNTPANNVHMFTIAGYEGHPSPVDADVGKQPIYIGLIAPGCSMIRNSRVVGLVAVPEDALRCFGVVRYNDVFGHTRETKFCVVQDRSEAPSFGPCPVRDHNRAD